MKSTLTIAIAFASLALDLAAETGEMPLKRIVSASLASDEILWDLLKSSRNSQLIGISKLAANPTYSNISAHIKGKTLVGDNLESLVALNPDLVFFAAFNRTDFINSARNAGIKTSILGSFSSISDIKENIAKIGLVMGCKIEAQALIKKISDAEYRASSRRKILRILNFSDENILMGKDTIFDDAINKAGGLNVATEINVKLWQKINLERIASLTPDLIIAPGEPEDSAKVIRKIQDSLGWNMIPAVKAQRVLVIPPRLLFTTSHHVADLILLLSKRFDEFQSQKS